MKRIAGSLRTQIRAVMWIVLKTRVGFGGVGSSARVGIRRLCRGGV